MFSYKNYNDFFKDHTLNEYEFSNLCASNKKINLQRVTIYFRTGGHN